MDDHKTINEEWFDPHQWQPDMPSPDVAWQDMLSRLDEEMPVATIVDKASKRTLLIDTKKQLLIILLLLLSLNIKYTQIDGNTQQFTSQSSKHLYGNNNKLQPFNHSNNSLLHTTQNGKTGADSISTTLQKSNRNHSLKQVQTQAPDTHNSIIKNNSTPEDSSALLMRQAEAVVNNTTQALQKQPSSNPKPTDSLQKSDEEDKAEKLSIQTGLQWTLPVPVAGTSNYFAGLSGTEQPWRVLLPGVWLSIKADRNLLMAEVNPFATASFNPKSPYSTFEQSDTAGTVTTRKALSKVFGLSGAISFQRNIVNNWWVGGGLQANFWHKGVGILTEKKHDLNTNSSTATTNAFAITKDDWQYFSKFQLYPHVQLMYRNTNYQAGIRSGVTFTSLAKDNYTAKNLMFTELFFRLPLINNNKNKK